jgi:TonB family protein
MRIMDSISPSPLAQAEQQATKRSPAVQNEKPSVSTREREVPAYSTSPTTPITETPSSNEEIVEETVVADAFKLEEPKSNDQPAVSPISPKRDEAEKKAEMPRAQRKKAYNADEDLSQGETYAKETTRSTRIITGTVKDSEDGSVMPGVSVMVKGTNARTITNAEGNYKLLLDDDPKGELVFSFIGMQSLEIPIERDSINAMLSPDYATLSEVVVVGYSVSDAHAIQEKENTYKSADPVGGRKAYKNYMIQNVKYPQQALDNKIQGKVTVQFTVESSGLLNDFKVLKGIGYGCDEEVIRLVKDGPKWTAPSRNDVPVKGKVKVRLKFALPK